MDPEKLRQYFETKCEIDSRSGKLIERDSKHRVVGIVPVHLYGQTADMDPILELANKYNLFVIEDACQAHGAEYFSKKDNVWKRAGSMGKAAAFSFYPGKNLGACGEGGAITTNDEAMAQRMKMIRDHGQERKYVHRIEGYNGRLDAIQAAILRVKLQYLAEWNLARRQVASSYGELLKGIPGVECPAEPDYAWSVYHLYALQVTDRDALRDALAREGIGVGMHYPVPLHLQEAYANLGWQAGAFPASESIAAHTLSMPMYPELREHEVERVAEVVRDFSSAAIRAASNAAASRAG